MADYQDKSGLKVDALLVDFVENEALPGLEITAEQFWHGFAHIVRDFAPRNRAYLAVRDTIQTKIDEWHLANGPVASNPDAYELFLRDIKYLVAEPDDFTIETTGLDPEITSICGPQLVVPVNNARYALNAANARWGSLFDALYGTDALSRDDDLAPGNTYNEKRGAAVFARASEFLDGAFPLVSGSHADITKYAVAQGEDHARLVIETAAGPVSLAKPEAFVGYREEAGKTIILLLHNGLHAELVVDATSFIGKTHKAGLSDVVLESALTTIQDCEDSVAAVDAEDKVLVYRNWLGLLNGTLEDTFEKAGKPVTRKLNPDRTYNGRMAIP
jgi:malate synthase